MRNYRVAVCDDETIHIQKIRSILYDLETDNYTCPKQLLEAISAGKRYDVLFLDILMPDLDGITLAKEIRELDEDMILVFITSQIEFMQTGYEVRAFRYLLKDQIDAGLPKIWQDIEAELQKKQDAYITYEFERKTCRYPVRDVLYLESSLRKIILHTRQETAVFYGKLDELEASCSGFVRIHKSYLVNRQHIRTISAGLVVLSNGEMLNVSRKYASVAEEMQ